MTARAFTLKRQNRSDEADGQVLIVERLRAYLPDEVWWTVSLSGIRLPLQVAVKAKKMGMQKGAPDFSFVLRDGGTRYIDLKTVDGDLTPEQKRLRQMVGAHNFKVTRVYPDNPRKTWWEFKGALDYWMAPLGIAWLTDTESYQREQRRRAA